LFIGEGLRRVRDPDIALGAFGAFVSHFLFTVCLKNGCLLG
jgi:hypothetical protein